MAQPGDLSRPARLRLFAAILLPEVWRRSLAAVQRQLEAAAPGYARWVDPYQLHLTLVFLKYQPEARLPHIEAALREASGGLESFELRLGRPGCFGPPARPRVIWAGLAGDMESLNRLHTQVIGALMSAGVSFDARPLAAHVTLGRAQPDAPRRAGPAMASAIAASLVGLSGPAFRAGSFSLMHSRLEPRGPTYTELARFELSEMQVRKP